MRKIAFVVMLLLLFGMLQPSFAEMIRSNERENYGALSLAFRAILGGIAGFFAGGVPGGLMGAGFMAFISPGCFHDPLDPRMY